MSIVDVLVGGPWTSRGQVQNTDENKNEYYPGSGDQFTFAAVPNNPVQPEPNPFTKIGAAGFAEMLQFPAQTTKAVQMTIQTTNYNNEYKEKLEQIIFYEIGHEVVGQLISLESDIIVTNVIAVGRDLTGEYMEMRSYWSDKDVGRYICRRP